MSVNTKTDLVILGAGIAGISASYYSKKIGINSIVFEASSRSGGLLDNFVVNEFRFDNAIHLSFANETEVRDIFDKTDYEAHPATSWCRDEGKWLKHPVQNNISPLSIDEKVNLIAGLVERPDISIVNYRDWLIYQYGESIAHRWPLPYTEKYWTVPAEELGIDWIGNRVRRADVREVLRGAFTSDTPNHYYANEMRYPLTGGYKSFIEPMIEGANICNGYQVVRISLTKQLIYFSNGEIAPFEIAINTLPLPLLIKLIEEVPREIRVAAESLFATSIDLISVGFNVPNIQPYLWFYIYDMDVLAARAYSPSIKSSDNVPPNCSSLQFEIYSSPRKPQRLKTDQLMDNTMRALLKMNIIKNKDEVIFMHHKHIPWGNVVFDLGMERRRDLVKTWLESVNILCAGRFGEWDYLWSNQALMSGKRAVEKFTANRGLGGISK